MAEHISPWVAARLDDVRAKARQWIQSPALHALVRALDGPPGATIDELLAWTSQTLDTRSGAERRDAEPVMWSSEVLDALVRAAGPLGLLATPTLELEAYDSVVVLGGATTGNELRTALVKDLVDGGLRVEEICGLAAHRAFSPSERDEVLVQEGVDAEWKHLLRCLDAAFGPLEAEGAMAGGVGAQPWLDHRCRGAGGQALRLLVAPSASSSRANTSEAVGFFLERHSDDLPRTLLVVTSAIYVPYQFFAVAGQLASGGISHVEFIGTPTSRSGDRVVLAQRVAQEIHSAVDSAAEMLRR
jgi:hypothetical protein